MLAAALGSPPARYCSGAEHFGAPRDRLHGPASGARIGSPASVLTLPKVRKTHMKHPRRPIAHSVLAEPRKAGTRGPSHPSILVVEDDLIIAEDIAAALRDRGAHVVGPACTTQEALELISEEWVDGAVLDVQVKDRSVFAVAEELRNRRIPFVFATGLADDSLPPEYRGTRTWTKPFDTLALARDLVTRSRGGERR